MEYNINQLAKLSEVSVRTLHHYDAIGLLSPKRNPQNEYRIYNENDLLLLQQILFFKELGFSLEEIKKILKSKNFDLEAALKDQKKMILLKKKRIDDLLATIDKTIKKIKKQKNMKDEELYDAFSEEELNKYKNEAQARWGHTDAYKQSTERVKKMGKEGLEKAGREGQDITKRISECFINGLAPENTETQKLIEKHFNWLANFYEPNLEIYKGLAEMYVADERFKKHYENFAEGLAEYMQKAMLVFVENQE